MIYLVFRTEDKELMAAGTTEWQVYDTVTKRLRPSLPVYLESVMDGKLTSDGRNRLYKGTVHGLLEWAVANRMPPEKPPT